MQDLLVSMRGIPAFVVYFVVSVAMLSLFLTLYVRVTPYREFSLIREGNAAAATSLSGAVLGFAIPFAKAIAQSGSLPDLLLWGAVAFAAQIAAYLAVRVLLPDVVRDIPQGRPAPAIFLAAVSITIGLLNAASMTY